MDLHFFPKIEKTTFTVSTVHFLLMFGYKLFSLYYPLFLVSIGLSVIKIGWVYLLIYGTIAIAAIGVNFWIHKINPSTAAAAGIFGYGVYALLMLFNTGTIVFYAAQILLGISAALWLVSLKSIIIESRPANYNSSFGWFYSAPEYASAFAPAIGGLVIYKFGFSGVFALSLAIQFANAIYAYFRLRKRNIAAADKLPITAYDFDKFKNNYLTIFRSLKQDRIVLAALAAIFAALILGGIYRAYFVLFLRDLNYSQDNILKFVSLISLLFIPLSWAVIKFISKISSYKNISFGIAADGIIFIIIGLWSSFINLIGMFMLLLVDSAAGLMVGSGKSGMIAAKFAKLKEEASTVDTILVTSGPALGGIIGGMAIAYIGYQYTFLSAGIVVFLAGMILWVYRKDIGY